MNMTHVRLKAVPVAIAVLMGGLGSSAFALPVTYGNITLDAAYSLGGVYNGGNVPDPVENGMAPPATIYSTSEGADQYLYTTNPAGDNAFFHTYGFSGPTYTYFGARASGMGNFFAKTSATFSQVFTNTSSTAQLFNFAFSVANGDLGISGTGNGFADLMLNVKKNGNSVARSRTTITQTAAGDVTCDDSSSDLGTLAGYMNCASPTGATAFDNGGLYGVSMGVIGAGESFTLDYDIIATVSGNLSQGSRWEEQCTGGYGDGGYGGGGDVIQDINAQSTLSDNGYGGYGGNCVPILVNVPGEAIARSGDPFEAPIFFNGQAVFAPESAGLRVSSNDVPEPGSIALVGLGLAGLAAMRRNRKRTDKA